jgi:hypothetical protein
MKTVTGILVAAAALLTACGAMYDESEFRRSEQQISAQDSQASGPTTMAAKDCSVSIQCGDGSWRSCNGTAGACSANGSGNGSVTCNGSTSSCPSSSSCTADGYCDYSCTSDPDCNFCQSGRTCYSNSECGFDGFCSNRRCVCY